MTKASKPMIALIAITALLLTPSASLDAADLDIVREGKVINLVHHRDRRESGTFHRLLGRLGR